MKVYYLFSNPPIALSQTLEFNLIKVLWPTFLSRKVGENILLRFFS